MAADKLQRLRVDDALMIRAGNTAAAVAAAAAAAVTAAGNSGVALLAVPARYGPWPPTSKGLAPSDKECQTNQIFI